MNDDNDVLTSRSGEVRRILFVVPRFHTNQIGWVTALRQIGCDVRMLVHTVGPTEDHSLVVPDRLPESLVAQWIRRLFGESGTNEQRYFPRLLELWRYLARFRPDIVIIRPHGMVLTLASAVMARSIGSETICYQQRTEPAPLKPHQWILNPRRVTYRLLMRVVARRTMTPLWNPRGPQVMAHSWRVVPFSVVASPPRHRESAARLKILTVGKMMPRKRIDLLLRAVAIHNASARLTAELVVVGECSTADHHRVLKELRGLVRQLGLDASVQFHLNVQPALMPSFYSAADIFVLPAEQEPASISVVEAMGHGLPVICSDSCGTQCYVRPGVTGGVFSSGSLDSLCSTLTGLLGDPAQLRKMGDWARHDALERFSEGAFVNGLSKALGGRDLGVCPLRRPREV